MIGYRTTSSGQREITLPEALSMARVPWARIVAAGHNLEAIAQEARKHGDETLYFRCQRAIRRSK